MTATATPDPVARLAEYRLEQSLTFHGLETAMREAGFPVPARVLHLALTHRLRTRPRETTLYKIQRFVETLAAVRKPARKRRRPAA